LSQSSKCCFCSGVVPLFNTAIILTSPKIAFAAQVRFCAANENIQKYQFGAAQNAITFLR